MTHVHLRELAARQDDLVAAWQLEAAGWTRAMIDHRLEMHGWRAIHTGVYALGQAPLTRRQRWRAATLTTPDSVLSHASAAACWGFRSLERSFEVVSRPGNAGRRRHGGLLVCHSKTLKGDVTRFNGLAITAAARTLVDLAPWLTQGQTARAFREALRLGVASVEDVAATVDRHRGRRGTRLLRELCARYAKVPYARTRSDAEALALERLVDAGLELPRVNVRVGGEEADLVDPRSKTIIEIDGPQYHRFREEDERKERVWREAGYQVLRLPSDIVYERPAELVRAVRDG